MAISLLKGCIFCHNPTLIIVQSKNTANSKSAYLFCPETASFPHRFIWKHLGVTGIFVPMGIFFSTFDLPYL